MRTIAEIIVRIIAGYFAVGLVAIAATFIGSVAALVWKSAGCEDAMAELGERRRRSGEASDGTPTLESRIDYLRSISGLILKWPIATLLQICELRRQLMEIDRIKRDRAVAALYPKE